VIEILRISDAIFCLYASEREDTERRGKSLESQRKHRGGILDFANRNPVCTRSAALSFFG
jgi:hypothetical protein